VPLRRVDRHPCGSLVDDPREPLAAETPAGGGGKTVNTPREVGAYVVLGLRLRAGAKRFSAEWVGRDAALPLKLADR